MTELGPDDKRMRLRYAGSCRLCRAPLSAGTEAVYERTSKTVRCIECEASTSDTDAGVAGTSARREFERRAAAREAGIRTANPRLGGLILALSDNPQSTRAWERGAIGEERMAERLKDPPDTFRVLHDRRIPGTRANIDHVVVGPSGVWVIDSKRYVDKRPTLHIEGGIIRPRTESLRIGGRDGTKLLVGVRGQVDKVAAAICDETIAVNGALCFFDADWPLIGGSFVIDGIEVLWPRLLVKRLTDAPPVEIDVAGVHSRLGAHFPSA